MLLKSRLHCLSALSKHRATKATLYSTRFCGCATTLEAAHKLGRKWIGIDIAIHAIKRVAKVRLEDRLGLVEGRDFVIDGVPRSFEGAYDLWERDTYQFQKWCVEQVDGFCYYEADGGDGGIDGRLYFSVPGERSLQRHGIGSQRRQECQHLAYQGVRQRPGHERRTHGGLDYPTSTHRAQDTGTISRKWRRPATLKLTVHCIPECRCSQCRRFWTASVSIRRAHAASANHGNSKWTCQNATKPKTTYSVPI